MRQAALFNGDRRALLFEGKSWTFKEAWIRGVRIANALITMGIRPGDRVAAVEDNTLAAADLFIGAAIAGAVRVPLYARNSKDSHKAMLRSTGSKVLFAEKHYADSVANLQDDLPFVQPVTCKHGFREFDLPVKAP
jgi:acyl-CoA synthetase (AMP-forming)/AMP-acid ligase II